MAAAAILKIIEILYEEAERHADKGYGTKNANV